MSQLIASARTVFKDPPGAAIFLLFQGHLWQQHQQPAASFSKSNLRGPETVCDGELFFLGVRGFGKPHRRQKRLHMSGNESPPTGVFKMYPLLAAANYDDLTVL